MARYAMTCYDTDFMGRYVNAVPTYVNVSVGAWAMCASQPAKMYTRSNFGRCSSPVCIRLPGFGDLQAWA